MGSFSSKQKPTAEKVNGNGKKLAEVEENLKVGRRRMTLLYNALVVTMDSENRVYRNGAVLIDGDIIVAIGQSSALVSKYNDGSVDLVNLKGKYLLPGFINTHVHSSQQLARGIADDLVLATWLNERVLPFEANMTEQDSYLSTLLCGIELIRSGVTCFAEAGGQHVPGMVRAVEELGLRACLTESVVDSGQGVPTQLIRTTQECIQSQRQLHQKYNGTAEGRIRIWLSIRQMFNSSDQLLFATRDTAKELKTGIHMHVSEVEAENEFVVSTRRVDHGTVTYLEKIKLLDSNLLAAQSVWINEAEIGFMSKANVKVSHCPAVGMRFFGFAPVREMINAGINVSLGTDGAPSNNRMSIVDEMYVASLINKGREVFIRGATDPTALPAETMLKMATINGAKSVLWDNEIGSLQVRKKADLIIVDPYNWTMAPALDSISSLVYSMRTENIESVMCNGRWLMKDGKILTVNEGDVIRSANNASRTVLKRAGIKVPTRMNFM